MRQRAPALIFALLLLFSGCGAPEETGGSLKRYEASFLELFDTVTTVVGFAETGEAFEGQVQELYDALEEYHQLYDIYEDYPGINNIKTINDNAGKGAVRVDSRITDLLLFSREIYDATDGAVNVALGSVLSLWHDARIEAVENPDCAALPDSDALCEAARHTDFDSVLIDASAPAVYIPDPLMSLDVGATAKGYALERVCRDAPPGLLISLGGNVKATGPKPDSGGSWTVGIEDPDREAESYLITVSIEDLAVVTSGDYQRYYTVEDKRYHHIIDPETLSPAELWRSVTVICPDSGLADSLSTALFLLSREKGQALLDMHRSWALWVDTEGSVEYSDGFFQWEENRTGSGD